MSADYNKQQRVIGRWIIGATLTKDDYSWVKRGQDIKTGKIVALKFIEKTNWVKEHTKQLEQDIEALKNVQHRNTVKLYTYNLNAQYPLSQESSTDEQQYIDTILLVLEYVAAELFDLLFYTSAFKEHVARTFFKQIIQGLQAYHNNNILVRHLEPQYLWLDTNYNLKMYTDTMMKTPSVGGYAAPELLFNQKYDLKCDIFSAGVILFILLAGYPPFEQARKTDKWFKPLMKGNIEKFWKAHRKSPIAKLPDARDLLTQMLSFDPKKRIDTNGIKSHKWYKCKTLKQRELVSEIHKSHYNGEKKRRQDTRKMIDVAMSLQPYGGIPGIPKATSKPFPGEYMEGMFGEVYTYLDGRKTWCESPCDLYNMMEEAITGQGKGKCIFDFDEERLNCEMTVSRDYADESRHDVVRFDVAIYESRLWKNRYQELEECDEIVEMNQHKIFVVKIKRTYGDTLLFNKLKNVFLLGYCSSIIKGLPSWTRKLGVNKKDMLRYKCLVKGYFKQHMDDLFEEHIVVICFNYYFPNRVIDLWQINNHSYGDDAYDDGTYCREVSDVFSDQNKGGIQINVT